MPKTFGYTFRSEYPVDALFTAAVNGAPLLARRVRPGKTVELVVCEGDEVSVALAPADAATSPTLHFAAGPWPPRGDPPGPCVEAVRAVVDGGDRGWVPAES